MAKKEQVKARVLSECVHGKPNDVVLLDVAVAKGAEKSGLVDATPEAVAYAEGNGAAVTDAEPVIELDSDPQGGTATDPSAPPAGE